MPRIADIQDYMVLSASINYQLTATPVNWSAVLSLVRDDPYAKDDDDVLIRMLEYLHEAYGTTTRRLGPLAVLHPIRTAALLLRTVPGTPQADLLTALLHDKDEDLTAGRYHPRVWQRLEDRYQAEVLRLDPASRMQARVAALARQPGDDYFRYLGKVLDCAAGIPELVRVKLADRLDNTLDMSVDIRSATRDVDCFELVFDVLFTGSHLGQRLPLHHPVTGRINGSRRLYQLYKNVVFLSILRQRHMDTVDEPAARLFAALAHWSLRQARQVLVHLFMFHVTSHHHQRALLEEAKEYCQQGRIARVHPGGTPHRLDGVLKAVFDPGDHDRLRESLDRFYADKPLMALVAIAMAATFSSFQNDPDFSIEGIDTTGLHPHGWD